MIEAERIVCSPIGHRKHALQIIERTKCNELTSSISGAARHRCSGQNEARADYRTCRKGASDASERIGSSQRSNAAARREHRILNGTGGNPLALQNVCRYAAGNQCPCLCKQPTHIRRLLRSDVAERLGKRQEGCPDSHGTGQTLPDVGGEESRLISSPLLKREEEEGAIFIERTAKSEPVLRSCERRIFDRCKGVACLETAVAQKSK